MSGSAIVIGKDSCVAVLEALRGGSSHGWAFTVKKPTEIKGKCMGDMITPAV